MIKEIIIFKEKHGDLAYDASTEEALGKAVLSVIKYRLEAEYWYLDEPIEGADQGNMFEKSPKTDAGQAREILALAETNLLKAGKAGLNFLADRSDYEYEGYDIIRLEKVEESWAI